MDFKPLRITRLTDNLVRSLITEPASQAMIDVVYAAIPSKGYISAARLAGVLNRGQLTSSHWKALNALIDSRQVEWTGQPAEHNQGIVYKFKRSIQNATDIEGSSSRENKTD